MIPKEETGQHGAEGRDVASLVFVAPRLEIGLDSRGQSVRRLSGCDEGEGLPFSPSSKEG